MLRCAMVRATANLSLNVYFCYWQHTSRFFRFSHGPTQEKAWLRGAHYHMSTNCLMGGVKLIELARRLFTGYIKDNIWHLHSLSKDRFLFVCFFPYIAQSV